MNREPFTNNYTKAFGKRYRNEGLAAALDFGIRSLWYGAVHTLDQLSDYIFKLTDIKEDRLIAETVGSSHELSLDLYSQESELQKRMKYRTELLTASMLDGKMYEMKD